MALTLFTWLINSELRDMVMSPVCVFAILAGGQESKNYFLGILGGALGVVGNAAAARQEPQSDDTRNNF